MTYYSKLIRCPLHYSTFFHTVKLKHYIYRLCIQLFCHNLWSFELSLIKMSHFEICCHYFIQFCWQITLALFAIKLLNMKLESENSGVHLQALIFVPKPLQTSCWKQHFATCISSLMIACFTAGKGNWGLNSSHQQLLQQRLVYTANLK